MINVQKGVGLMEVLVALFLLALGVLGFTALQLRAVDATSEAFNRVQAMSLARDFAERIRINSYALTILKLDNTAIRSDTDDSAYIKAVKDNKDIETVYSWASCYGSNTCTSALMAVEDVKQVVYKAALQGMKVNLMTCQSSTTTTPTDGTSPVTTASNLANTRKCIYVAWGETTPTEGDLSTDCSQYGIYKDGSKCVILEAY